MWFSRAALDVIGLAGTPLPLIVSSLLNHLPGFGYTFNALQSVASDTPIENELADAFNIIFSTARKFRVITVLQAWFPFLRPFVSSWLLSLDDTYGASTAPE